MWFKTVTRIYSFLFLFFNCFQLCFSFPLLKVLRWKLDRLLSQMLYLDSCIDEGTEIHGQNGPFQWPTEQFLPSVAQNGKNRLWIMLPSLGSGANRPCVLVFTLLEGALSLGSINFKQQDSSHDEPELFNPKLWNNLEVRDGLSAYADGKMATEVWKAPGRAALRGCSVVTSWEEPLRSSRSPMAVQPLGTSHSFSLVSRVLLPTFLNLIYKLHVT